MLGDSAVVIEQQDGELVVGHDDRTSYLPGYTVEAVSRARNTEEGFWIASIRPDAADRAVTGTVPTSAASRAVIMTDGITRLVERYGWSWADLLKRLDSHGPNQLVEDIRAEERATPAGAFRGKVHDDATAVFCQF